MTTELIYNDNMMWFARHCKILTIICFSAIIILQNASNWLLGLENAIFPSTKYDDFLFDIVYTYVNGSNEEYRQQKEHWFYTALALLGNERLQEKHSFLASLSKDNNELCFSLRSIEKYMPWFRGHIYIVSDQTPNWLKTSQSQLHIISTKQIIDHRFLPTFSSHAIEANLHKIPNLKEFYLYLNDDYIIGRPVSIDDFFLHHRCPVIYGDDRLTSNTNVTLNIHKKAMLNTNAILDGLLFETNSNFNETERHFLPHAPHPIRKSVAEEVWVSKFSEIHREQSSHRFRDMNDVHPTYFITRYLIEQTNHCVEQRQMKSACVLEEEDFCNYVLKNNYPKVRKFFADLHWRLRMPKFLSINDRTDSNYTMQRRIQVEFQRFLKGMFPEKSRFEAHDCTL